jgi:hypothetical protein
MMTERECLTWILGFTFGKNELDSNDLTEMAEYIHSTLTKTETWELEPIARGIIR